MTTSTTDLPASTTAITTDLPASTTAITTHHPTSTTTATTTDHPASTTATTTTDLTASTTAITTDLPASTTATTTDLPISTTATTIVLPASTTATTTDRPTSTTVHPFSSTAATMYCGATNIIYAKMNDTVLVQQLMNLDNMMNCGIENEHIDDYEQVSEYSQDAEESQVAFDRQNYVYQYLQPEKSLDFNYDIFLNNYLLFSAQHRNAELNLNIICFELFILEVNTPSIIISDWVQYLMDFSVKIKNILITELKGRYLLKFVESNPDLVIPDNLTPTSIMNDEEYKKVRLHIVKQFDKKQKTAFGDLHRNQARSINRTIFHIAEAVLKLFDHMKDLDAFSISKMLQDIQFEQEVNQLLTGDKKIITLLQNSSMNVILELTKFVDKNKKNSRDAFNDNSVKSKLRKLDNTDYSIYGQSSSRRKGTKRKVVEDDVDVEVKSSKHDSPINKVSSDDPQLSTHTTSSNVPSHCHDPQPLTHTTLSNVPSHCHDPQPLTHATLSNVPVHRQLQSNFLDSDSDIECIDDNDLKSTTKLFKWFENLQNMCDSCSENMRLNVSFTDHKQQLQAYFLRTCKLAQVRTAFSNLMAEKSTDITVDEIQMFLSSEAYFHLQLKWDQNLYACTTGDGLCLYRSLYQLYRLHSMNKIRSRNIIKMFQETDAKLTAKLDREEFVSFLERILSCAEKVTFATHNNHGGDLNDKKFYVDDEEVKVAELPRYIKKLEEAIKLLKNEQYTDWQNFNLDAALWGNFDLIKLIPFLFSTSSGGLMEFHGSYYKANDAIHSFAYLICSMEYSTNSIRSTEPISLKKKHLEEVLEKPNIIYSGQHFFPLVTNAKREDISSGITEISGKILKFIHEHPMPTMTKKSTEVNSMRVTSNESNNLDRLLIENETLKSEIAKMRNAHTKDRAAELKLAKDRAAELEKKNAALEEELRNYKKKMGEL